MLAILAILIDDELIDRLDIALLESLWIDSPYAIVQEGRLLTEAQVLVLRRPRRTEKPMSSCEPCCAVRS